MTGTGVPLRSDVRSHRSSEPPVVVCSVWMEPVADRSATLSPGELARWRRYRRDEDRHRFSTGVHLQKRALREVCGTDVALVRRCPGCGADDHGPVGPAAPFAARWSMSMAHGHEMVLVAMVPAPLRVGIDVEILAGRHDAVSRSVFSDVERSHDDRFADAETRSAARTRRWCRKEAVLKAVRLGVATSMTALQVSGADDAPRVVAWEGNPSGISEADMHLVDIDADILSRRYAASLAVLGPARVRVRYA